MLNFLTRTRQNKLSVKIGIAFGLVALILIGTLAFTLYRIHQTNLINQNLSEQITPELSAALNVQRGLGLTLTNQRDLLITANPEYKKKRDEAWDKMVVPFNGLLKALLASTPQSKTISIQLESTLTTLKNNITKLDQSNLSKQQQADYFYTNIEPTTNQIQNLLNTFIHNKQNNLLAGLQSVRKQIIYIFIIDAGFLMLGLILCILLGIVLTNLVTKPVKLLVKMTDELAKGNLTQEINLTEAEEFENLSASINHVIKTLRDLAKVTQKMSEGNYDQYVDVKSDKDKLAINTNQMLDNFNAIVKQANAIAEGNYNSEITPRSEHDELGIALQNMTLTLRKNQSYNDEQNWLKDGLANFANVTSEARDITKLCNDVMSAICRYCEAGMGAIYLLDKKTNNLKLQGSFAFTERNHLASAYEIGQGLVGQVGYENKAIMLKSPSGDVATIDTGLTKQAPSFIYAFPLTYEKNLIGVMELAWLNEPHSLTYHYLDELMPILASHIQATQQQNLTESLLNEQKLLTEKLSTQQEELKASNEELEHQAQVLKASEEELRIKDEEQRKINTQLEERTKELEQQKSQIEQTNEALKATSKALEDKAEELTIASRYKSEFLANMSHELRTPLNSLLILAKIFAENDEHNLNEEQIESAKIMLKSGQDLLTLINDILDLAKVEAGKLDVHLGQMKIKDMASHLKSIFSVVAEDKGITFALEITDDVPEYIITDEQRVSQIIRNLLSNAIKFTSEGQVKLCIYCPHRVDETMAADFDAKDYLAISVVDTGIGIPPEKQKLVFESFQQADGTTSRKYGGTGLGLSISREFSRLVNGQIALTSTYGKGSTFTLYLPLNMKAESDNTEKPEIAKEETIQTETAKIALPKASSNKLKKLLLIEDDTNFANTLMTLCRKKGYLCRHVTTAEDALNILQKDIPDAILLDLQLPGMGGFEFIDKLKANSTTAKIPIQVISSSEESASAIKRGAIGYLTKPITDHQLTQAFDVIESDINQDIKTLLIVEDNQTLAEQIKKLIQKSHKQINIDLALTGSGALKHLKDNIYDCVILDLGLPDMSGIDLIQKYHANNINQPPSIIIYTGQSLSDEQTQSLNQFADSIIIKGNEASINRLLQETSAFLEKTKEKQKHTSKKEDKIHQEAKILVVDDDSRNLFAIKKILEKITKNIITANNGEKALTLLKENNDIQLVLMDIMMPVMDGYEAIEHIRKDDENKNIPIIALTAKALSNDKQKCLDAGANDYVTKPIDCDILLDKVNALLENS